MIPTLIQIAAKTQASKFPWSSVEREDLIQECYLALWEKGFWNSVEIQLLHRICRFACVDRIRKEFRTNQNGRKFFPPVFVPLNGDSVNLEKLSNNRISLMQLLSKIDDRNAFVIGKHIDGFTLKEIGKEMGVTESRVCQQYAAGVDLLKKRNNKSRRHLRSHSDDLVAVAALKIQGA